MAKPWARIEQNFINHQKFLALSANAICLWLEGKNYCDMYQTDGLIPLTALKTFRFDAAKSRTLLQTSCGLKPNGTPYAPLWESVELGGVAYFRMHDYLDHNDCRDAVLSRIAMADTRKEADRVRKAEARAAKDAKQRPQDVREMSARTSGGIPSEIRSITETETETKEAKREKSASLSPPADPARDPFTDPIVTERAGRFIERYETLYTHHRGGARYTVRPQRDYAAAVTLCQTWPDDARLDRIAVVFLTCEHKFADEGSRTIPQFLALASWCDDRLAQWEKAQPVRVAAV
jgi:hypothetical protein